MWLIDLAMVNKPHKPNLTPSCAVLRELGKNASLYGQFVGAWRITVFEYPETGLKRERQGEWHFCWVLEGRAIEDVFIVPPREGNRYGASLRVYDATRDEWQVTWINPVTLAYNRLVGRRQGEEIVQEGTDDGQPYRWIFSDITPDSFRWRGESSSDGGKTWRLDVEFFARRMAR